MILTKIKNFHTELDDGGACFKPRTWETKAGEFVVNLLYRLILRTARVMQRNCILKKPKKTNNPKTKNNIENIFFSVAVPDSTVKKQSKSIITQKVISPRVYFSPLQSRLHNVYTKEMSYS